MAIEKQEEVLRGGIQSLNLEKPHTNTHCEHYSHLNELYIFNNCMTDNVYTLHISNPVTTKIQVHVR